MSVFNISLFSLLQSNFQQVPPNSHIYYKIFFPHFPGRLNPFRIINSLHFFWQGNLLLEVILVTKEPIVSASAIKHCIGVAVIVNNIILYSQPNLTVIFETQLVKQFKTSYPLSSGIIKKNPKER